MPERFTGTDRPSWVTDWRTLHRVADRQAPTVEQAFVALVAEARGGQTRSRIQRALQRGNRRQALTIAVEAWRAASETWRTTLVTALRDAVRAAATAVGTRMVRDARIELAVTNPAAQQWAETQAGGLIRQITADQRQSIWRVIGQAFTENLPTRQVAIRLTEQIGLHSRQAAALERFRADLVEKGLRTDRVSVLTRRARDRMVRRRARSIARTEVLRASNMGQQLLWEAAVDAGEWRAQDVRRVFIVTPDDRLCPVCAPLDGMIVGLADEFVSPTNGASALVPPIHPQCLPGESCISASGIAAASERPFDGDLLVISTASGKQLACTPNHPILTSRGWQSAHALDLGGDVISHRVGQWMGATQGHDQEVPTGIQDVAKAVGCSEEMSPVPVPVTAEDFHGDGERSEIAVIRTNRLLMNDINAALLKQPSQAPLIGRDVEPFPLDGAGTSELLVHRQHSTSRCRMCGRDLFPASGGAHVRPLHALGLGLRAWSDPNVSQSSGHQRAGNAEVFRQRGHRPPASVPRHHVIDGEIGSRRAGVPTRFVGVSEPMVDHDRRDAQLARDVLAGLAGPVFADDIVDVHVTSWHGPVYNVETESGAYLAGGIVTHNCRCAVGIDTALGVQPVAA